MMSSHAMLGTPPPPRKADIYFDLVICKWPKLGHCYIIPNLTIFALSYFHCWLNLLSWQVFVGCFAMPMSLRKYAVRFLRLHVVATVHFKRVFIKIFFFGKEQTSKNFMYIPLSQVQCDFNKRPHPLGNCDNLRITD